MTELPSSLREELSAAASVAELSVEREAFDAESQTTKTLFRLADGALIESVLMDYVDDDGGRRHTVCLSTQVGCPLRCSFCATGLMGWTRDLVAAEMVGQVLHFGRVLKGRGEHVTNVVYMGMGEPLLNFDAVWRSIQVLGERSGFGLGARHFTLSTSGVVPGLRRLTEQRSQVGLAVSLHAADDELRSELVPLNRRYPISEVMRACRDYVQATHRRISFEYTMLDAVNDSPACADSLARLLHGLLCHVNLIPWNRVDGLTYHPSQAKVIVAFRDRLAAHGIPVTIRDTRGSRIAAACGQLRTETVRRRGAGGPRR
jgi:23S rRNA (adenine2503-C2)-methyltransferase